MLRDVSVTEAGIKPYSLNPEKILQQIKTHLVNRMTASPFFVKEVSIYVINNKISVDNMQNIFTGGAPVFLNEAELYVKVFPGAKIEIVYRSTEADPISSVSAERLIDERNTIQEKGLLVGKIDDDIEAKVIKITDENICIRYEEELLSITLPFKQIGEIIVKGKHVLTEYYNNAEALKRNKIFIGNICWHRTGDSGSIDENGMLYLTGRCYALIKYNGKILSAFVMKIFFKLLMMLS